MDSNTISTDKSLVSWSVAWARGRTSAPNLTLSATRGAGGTLAGGLFPSPDGKYFVQFYYKNYLNTSGILIHTTEKSSTLRLS